jgi:hypothetical protein
MVTNAIRILSSSWRRTSGAALLVGGLGLGAVVASGPAYAWEGTTTIASPQVGCNTATGIQTASVTVNNNGGVNAVVTASTGPIFLVGDTIPSTKTEQFTKPGSFSGDVVLSFSVNYPPQDTASHPVGPVTITFAGGCETTTTPAPTVVVPFVYVPPTTAAPTTVAPTTVAPTTVAPTTVAPVPVVQPEVAPTTAAPAQVLGEQLAVTGHNTNPLTWIGLTLIALGMLAVTFGTRRIGSLRRR